MNSSYTSSTFGIDGFKDGLTKYNLSTILNICGIHYNLKSNKSVDLTYNSFSNFNNDFLRLDVSNYNTKFEPVYIEYILRKYMYPRLQYCFDSEQKQSEKHDLILILKARSDILKNSKSNRATIKNTRFNNSQLKLEEFIDKLKDKDTPLCRTLPDLTSTLPLTCDEASKYMQTIPALDNNKLYDLILKLSWMLLNPNDVPEKIKCSWDKLIHELQNTSINDILTNTIKNNVSFKNEIIDDIRDATFRLDEVSPSSSISSRSSSSPNLSNLPSFSRESSLSSVSSYNRLNQLGGSQKNEMDDHIKTLLTVNQCNKFLNSNEKNDTLHGPLNDAMLPLFDYFRDMYDPIYSFLEMCIHSYMKNNKIKKVMPSLLNLLHIANNIPDNNYGVYRIRNANNTLSFIKNIVSSSKKVKDKDSFHKQISELPKISLSSLSNSNHASSVNFFTVGTKIGNNITILPKNKINETVYNELSFFDSKNIYIVFSESPKNIPMNVYDIDFNTVDSSNPIIVDNMDDNYFNKHPGLFLDKLVKLKENFNDAELAMSIFITFKEIISK